MRLAPIEEPKSWRMRLAYWFCRRQLGKVITPMKTVYARTPNAFPLMYHMNKVMHGSLSLDRGLILLLATRTATLNGCHFCVDIGQAFAVREGLDVDKLAAVDAYETDPRFTERERAAVRYVEAATRDKHVPDEIFAALNAHFTDTEIVEITLVNAVENFYNQINIPLEIEADGLCVLARHDKREAHAKAAGA